MLGFGALFGGMEGRGCWGPALGEERDGQSEILCRGEQRAGPYSAICWNPKIKEDQQGVGGMPYGPRPWGVVMAGTELPFLVSALQFLQIFTQARKPCVSTALGVMKGTESIWAVRNTIQMENDM